MKESEQEERRAREMAEQNRAIKEAFWKNSVDGVSLTSTPLDTYSTLFHNHETYTTTKGKTANIYRPNGKVNSARAAKFARTSQFFKGTGVVSSATMASQGAYNIYNGDAVGLDYVDASVGVIGVGAGAASLAGYTIPIVGQAAAIYGLFRVAYELGGAYGPSKWYGTNDNKWFK